MDMEQLDLMMKLIELIRVKNEMASQRMRHKAFWSEPQPYRSTYTCQPGRVTQCHFKEKHKANAYPRTCQRIVATDSHIYVLGGYNALNSVPPYNMFRNFQELWSFNLATKRWKQEIDSDNAGFPDSFFISAIVPYHSVLLLFGGLMMTPETNELTNDCFVFRQSETVPKDAEGVPGRVPGRLQHFKMTGDVPQADYGQGTVIHNKYLYAFGQPMTLDYTSNVHRLNLTTMVWEKIYTCIQHIQRIQHDLYRNETVYDGKHIFVLGNGTIYAHCDLKRIPAYNLESNTWDFFDTLPDASNGYPQRRLNFSTAQHKASNGDIEAYITGGTQQGIFKDDLTDIWKLNMRTMKWTMLDNTMLPSRIHGHSAAQFENGCMYIYGGTAITNGRKQPNTEVHKMWLTIPKLKDMCWDAITYYNENLDRHDRKKLLESGIPKCYTDCLPPQRNLEKPSTSK